MNSRLLPPFLALALALGLSAHPLAAQVDLAALCDSIPSPSDVAKPEGFPEIGKWMIASDGSIASWLGWRYFGKGLFEPINVIIFDPIAKSGDEAYARLEAAALAVEFEMRAGHSTGYDALIGTTSFEQLPTGKGHAISDGPFELPNNHGRIFGPYPWKGGWIFTAAFSREFTDLVTKVKHHYSSFNQARDAFAWALDRSTKTPRGAGEYKIQGFVPLGNCLLGSPSSGTGDHDGHAAYIVAAR